MSFSGLSFELIFRTILERFPLHDPDLLCTSEQIMPRCTMINS
jgi:hypothetical protein